MRTARPHPPAVAARHPAAPRPAARPRRVPAARPRRVPAARPRQVPAARHPAARGDPAAGATALCNDGSYSYAAHHQGACSHHGGVAVFYR
ncbi:DUF3761 domain-containing protein [Streptomyces iranensis]|uniref:DUF3761 domain-containing protein n=1 Tax=Streptomyces iranensis TaxID=576784 RepID=UPI0039B74813